MKIYLNLRYDNIRILNIINLFKLRHDPYASLGLLLNHDSLELYHRDNINQKSIKVDFLSKKNNDRCWNLKKKMKFYIKYRE